MNKHLLQKSLTSCRVNKKFVTQLENYFLVHVPKILKNELSNMMELTGNRNIRTLLNLSLFIRDQKSAEVQELKTVTEYKAAEFSPSLKSLAFHFKVGLPEILNITLRFSQKGRPSLEIVATNQHPTQTANRIYDNIKTLLGNQRNGNWVVHSRAFIALTTLGIPALVVGAGHLRGVDLFFLYASQGWILLLAGALTFILTRLFPQVSFVTSRRFPWKKTFFWLLFILDVSLIAGYVAVLLFELSLKI